MKTTTKKSDPVRKPRVSTSACAPLLAAILSATLPMPRSVNAEIIGTSQADLPSLVGKLVIHNDTGVTQHYRLKWGQNGAEQVYTLESGRQYEHTHALNNHKAPAPYLRYDYVAGDAGKTYKALHLAFGEAGYAGYGPRGYIDESVHYRFEYGANGKILNFYRQ